MAATVRRHNDSMVVELYILYNCVKRYSYLAYDFRLHVQLLCCIKLSPAVGGVESVAVKPARMASVQKRVSALWAR